MRNAAVIGTGLIGTSIALALTRRGLDVYLEDADPDVLWTAASLGAGTSEPPGGRVDLAVIAVPPAQVGAVLAGCQRRRLAHCYTDVAGVKAGPRADIAALGLDTAHYLGGHPMAGLHRRGPLAARADLFEGRPWVLTPDAGTDTGTLNAVLELIAFCGAMPMVMDAAAHDRAVALISQAPQLVSSLIATRLEDADETAVRLSGQGIREVTRIAAATPALLVDALAANAGVVADVLAEVAADLADTVAALRGLQAADAGERQASLAGIETLIRRGNTGQARIPGKHGAPPASYEAVTVVLGDQPGELGRLFGEVGFLRLNIEDVTIEHSTGRQTGHVQLAVAPASAKALAADLRDRGWNIQD